jgi:endo-1,4-beta-D-glucanase Y
MSPTRCGAIITLAVVATVSGCGHHDSAATTRRSVEAAAEGRNFLQTYVADDGRVRRLDEGDDTVSEAQAYGLLISLAIGDQQRFDAIWAWTRTNLQRTDGLLAWHWQAGKITDPEPAADADVLTAYALVAASQRFHQPDLHRDAVAVASAVLDHETLTTPSGPVLLSPWAKPTRIINPSYLAPFVFDVLADATGDPTWAAAAATARQLVATVVTPPTRLAPDWTTLRSDGAALSPAPSPTGQDAEIGLDAWRAPVFLAADCHTQGRTLAAHAWTFLRHQHPVTAVYHLDGTSAVTWSHPAALVGAAATAHAAGDAAATEQLLTAARQLNLEHPSYYGSAWLALSSLLLGTDRLGGCATDKFLHPTGP